jgi:hypothetical protein
VPPPVCEIQPISDEDMYVDDWVMYIDRTFSKKLFFPKDKTS